jgi:hypothetical protein
MAYNGLVVSGSGDELVLIRPESRRELVPPKRRWNGSRILSARLFRLGYLAPDPILRRYRDEIGTREGHAVLVPKANVLIAIDTDAALEELGGRIDAETIAAMGADGSDGPGGGPRPPSLGAVATRECLHFYLLAYARAHRIPIAGQPHPGSAQRHYEEADVWLSNQGFDSVLQEFRRVNELVAVAREAVAQGWIDPRPDRTLTPAAQKRLEIRFGLVNPLPGVDRTRATKKAARKKR